MEYHDQVPTTWYETIVLSPNQDPAFQLALGCEQQPTGWGVNENNQDAPWAADHWWHDTNAEFTVIPDPPNPQVATSSSASSLNTTQIPEWAQQLEPSHQPESDPLPNEEELTLLNFGTTWDSLRQRFEGLGGEKPPIGRGTYGTVYEIQDRATHEVFAAKIIPRYDDKAKNEMHVLRQICMGDDKFQPNPHVVRVWETLLIYDPNFPTCNLQLFIRMERCLGTLDTYILYERREGRLLTLDIIFGILTQVLFALGYCHDAGFLHRDIKPGNVLLSSNECPRQCRSEHLFTRPYQFLLTDFGFAKENTETPGSSYPAHGTPGWRAPELVGPERLFSAKTDIWAFGCLIYYVATTGLQAFNNDWHEHHFNNGDVIIPSLIAGHGDEQIMNEMVDEYTIEGLNVILAGCWNLDPDERFSATQLKVALQGLLELWLEPPEQTWN